MKQRFLVLSLGIGAMLLATQHAFSQARPACAPRDRIVKQLSAKFGETRQSIGLGNDNTLVETFASPDTGTWTITVTRAGGTTCIAASGQAFESIARQTPPTGDPA